MSLEKKIFEFQFSAAGPGIGEELHEFTERPSSLLVTSLPEDYQEAAVKIVQGFSKGKRGDYSFIPSKDGDVADFARRWEQAYRAGIRRYKEVTDSMFDAFKRRAIFEPVNITNELELKRAIKRIAASLYSRDSRQMQSLARVFERFDQNIPYQQNLEGIDNYSNILCRVPKKYSCPIDVFIMRYKSFPSLAVKFSGKWIDVRNKIEECRVKGRSPELSVDDLLITDIFGFSMVGNDYEHFDDNLLFTDRSLVRIEDESKSPGQRQIKFLDMADGIIFDFHVFRTMQDWVEREFPSEELDSRVIVPHDSYKRRKILSKIEKRPKLNWPIFEQLEPRCLNVLNECYITTPGETDFDTYQRLNPSRTEEFLTILVNGLSEDFMLFRTDAARAKKKNLTIPGLQARLTTAVRCYNGELRKRFSRDLENVVDENQNPRQSINDMHSAVYSMIGEFAKISRREYKTRDLEEFEDNYRRLLKICELNKQMAVRYKECKKAWVEERDDSRVRSALDYFRNIFDGFDVSFPGEDRITMQTKFNLCSYLTNCSKIYFLNPENSRRTGGVHFSRFFEYVGGIHKIYREHPGCLSEGQISKIKAITEDPNHY